MTDKIDQGRVGWIRDELILALDVYLRLAPVAPDPRSQEVRDLSELLRGQHIRPYAQRNENFRSPASIVMKLMNFRSIDPSYGGKGLTAGGRLDRQIWEEFAADRVRLSSVAGAIRAAVNDPTNAGARNANSDEGDYLVEAEEGAVLSRLHRVRERDPRLVQSKKRTVIRDCGRLCCEVCGFCFSDNYGELGDNFIECHHRKPLCDLSREKKTSLEDLALLCANCHRMIHSRRPWLTVEQLRVIVVTQAR